MNFKLAIAAATALMAASGVNSALADVANGNYVVKSAVSKIGTATGNAAICTILKLAVGASTYSFEQLSDTAFTTENDRGGVLYVSSATLTSPGLVGKTISQIPIFPEGLFDGFLTSNGKSLGTNSVTVVSATANATGYAVVVSRVLSVPGLGSCSYSTKDTWISF